VSADDLIALLDSIGKTTFEFTGDDVAARTKEPAEALVDEYPGIAPYSNYLDLLRATGGTYTENDAIDLGLYGFGGEGVTSFEEGNFLDQDRYFLFGELMHLTGEDDPLLLAFDTASGRDEVLYTTEEPDEYTPFAGSFRELLEKLAGGDYPPSVRNVSE
jgi:hypothetical protein